MKEGRRSYTLLGTVGFQNIKTLGLVGNYGERMRMVRHILNHHLAIGGQLTGTSGNVLVIHLHLAGNQKHKHQSKSGRNPES